MTAQVTKDFNVRYAFLIGLLAVVATLLGLGLFVQGSQTALAGAPALVNAPLDTPTATGTPVEPEVAILEYVVAAHSDWTCGPIGGTPGHRSLGCYTGAGHNGNPASAYTNWQQRHDYAQLYYPVFQDTSWNGFAGYHGEGPVPPYNFFTQEDYYLADVRVLGGTRVDDTNFHYAPDIATAIMNAAAALGYLPSGASPTPIIVTPSATPTATATSLITATVTTTATVSPTPTPSVGVSPTACAITFTDVPVDSTFYSFIRCLACRDIMSGYPDGSFRPGNNITRGQIAKIVSNAAGFDDDVAGSQSYSDVLPDSTFWLWVERLSLHDVMGGYACGGVGEPCDGESRPYFRPGSNATRGQLAKIVANAAELGGAPTGQFYADVPEGQTFYVWIMRLTELGVVGGYACGGAGEPCDGESRPYFRPGSNVTRGQASKVVGNTFFPDCVTP